MYASPLSRNTFHRDLTAMCVDDFLYDAHAEAQPLDGGIVSVGSVELVKNPFNLRLAHADAAIDYR